MTRYKAFYGHSSGWHFSGPNDPETRAEANDIGVDIVLASDVAALLDNIIVAYDLPGDHCELSDAIEQARRFLAGEEEA